MGTLHRTKRRQLIGTGFGRLQRHSIVLLAPYCRFSVDHYLRGQDAVDAFVESRCRTLSHQTVNQAVAIGFATIHDIAEKLEHIDHRIVIISNVYLIMMVLGPELGPSAIVILSAEQKGHSLAERLTIAVVMSLLKQTCQKRHLHRRGLIVDSRIVKANLLPSDAVLLFTRQRPHHIDILRPSASVSLIKQQLLTYPTGFCRQEEGAVLLLQHLIVCQRLGLQAETGSHECRESQHSASHRQQASTIS